MCSSCTPLPLKSCGSCGAFLSPSQWKCIDVPFSKPLRPAGLTLTGDLEKPIAIRSFMQNKEVGRPILQQSTSEARFAAHVQFRFSWRGDSCFIAPVAETPNDVIINENLLTKETELLHGDIIMLRSRKSERTAMPLVVEYFN